MDQEWDDVTTDTWQWREPERRVTWNLKSMSTVAARLRRTQLMHNFFIYSALLLSICGCNSPQSSPLDDSMDARSTIFERIGDINDFSLPRPLVTLEEFFTGNEDYASIGYNLPDQPAPQEFFRLLRRIRDRSDVSDVRIEVKDLEDPDGWPSTDTIWVITTANGDEVVSWLPDSVKPDDVLSGFDASASSIEAYDLPRDMNAIGIWYD